MIVQSSIAQVEVKVLNGSSILYQSTHDNGTSTISLDSVNNQTEKSTFVIQVSPKSRPDIMKNLEIYVRVEGEVSVTILPK